MLRCAEFDADAACGFENRHAYAQACARRASAAVNLAGQSEDNASVAWDLSEIEIAKRLRAQDRVPFFARSKVRNICRRRKKRINQIQKRSALIGVGQNRFEPCERLAKPAHVKAAIVFEQADGFSQVLQFRGEVAG